jgi:lipopolysaccharide biosynthesis regulator YciM
MSVKHTKIILVAGAVLLFVLLYTAPKTAPHKGKTENKAEVLKADNNASVNVYLGMAEKSLPTDKKQTYDGLMKEKKTDSLENFWDLQKRPDLASVYAEEIAKASGKAEDWFKAGTRYYYSVQFIQDKTETPLLYQCAMRCFSRGLKTDPKNTDAQIMLASCFVEGSSDPMKGIGMLKEVEKTDSNNVKLQLTFAFFSKKSGQNDKALSRFKKVIQLDSAYIEAYLHMADIYEQQGNTAEAIDMLEKYGAKTPDPTEKTEINKYIQQLKK